MSITIASGGFDGTIRSDSGGNIFIETTGNTKTINIGGLQSYTGSIIQELDKSTGNIVKSKELKSDGTIEEKQFTSAGIAIETKIKDPVKGKEFIRSGSASNNQIEFEQHNGKAFISVSGSESGYNFIEPTRARIQRSSYDYYLSGSSIGTLSFQAVDDGGNFKFNFNPTIGIGKTNTTLLTISSSGDVFVPNGKLIAKEYVVSSSVINQITIAQSGSTNFGDTPADDTHKFTGSLDISGSGTDLTVNGNISSSGDVFAHSGSFNYITASIIDVDADTIRFGGEPFTKSNILTLKEGKSLKTVGDGKSHGDITAHDGTFDGDIFKTKLVQMTNSSSVIDTFNTGSFRSAKYVLQVISASNFQVSEMLVLHHNSTASNTEYAQINSGINLINFTTDVNNSNVRLNAAGSFISCSVRYDRTIIPL